MVNFSIAPTIVEDGRMQSTCIALPLVGLFALMSKEQKYKTWIVWCECLPIKDFDHVLLRIALNMY
jgi:hypothetical protein